MIGARVLAATMSRNCVGCGASFVIESNHPRQKYCSLLCSAQFARRKHHIKPCVVCGAPFLPETGGPLRYCSVACSNVARARLEYSRER